MRSNISYSYLCSNLIFRLNIIPLRMEALVNFPCAIKKKSHEHLVSISKSVGMCSTKRNGPQTSVRNRTSSSHETFPKKYSLSGPRLVLFPEFTMCSTGLPQNARIKPQTLTRKTPLSTHSLSLCMLRKPLSRLSISASR